MTVISNDEVWSWSPRFQRFYEEFIEKSHTQHILYSLVYPVWNSVKKDVQRLYCIWQEPCFFRTVVFLVVTLYSLVGVGGPQARRGHYVLLERWHPTAKLHFVSVSQSLRLGVKRTVMPSSGGKGRNYNIYISIIMWVTLNYKCKI